MGRGKLNGKKRKSSKLILNFGEPRSDRTAGEEDEDGYEETASSETSNPPPQK